MKNFKRILYSITFALLGLIIPVSYFIHEVSTGSLQVNLSNIFTTFSESPFFIVGAIIFPPLAIIIGEVIWRMKHKHTLIKKDFDYLKLVLNTTPDALVFLDENKKILFQNNKFRLLFSDFDEIMNEPSIKNLFGHVEYFHKEINLKSSICDDHPFLMIFKLTKFSDTKNYFVSFQDLKVLKDKEQIIERQKEQMIEHNKLASLGEMAAGIGHEINNPLTVIHSNNSIIQRLIAKPEVNLDKINQLTKKTREQVERITGIITSLRNLSRGMANEDFEEFCLSSLIEETISLAKIRDQSKKIIFQTNNTKVSAYANRGQIVQVIINLLSNAIDAVEGHETPWISLELKDCSERTELRITDSGIITNSEVIEKIFLPMYTTKSIGKGTGLGLSLSRTFAEQNCGTLEYVAKTKNTCFKLTLLQKAPKTNVTQDELIKKAA